MPFIKSMYIGLADDYDAGIRGGTITISDMDFAVEPYEVDEIRATIVEAFADICSCPVSAVFDFEIPEE